MSFSPASPSVRRPPHRGLIVAATAALALLLTACGGSTAAPQPTDPATPAAAGSSAPEPQATTEPQQTPEPQGTTEPQQTPDPQGTQGSFSLADVLRRYPTCAAIGTVLGSELDGMALDETSTADADGINCRWLPAVIAGQRSRTKGISVDPNGGAGDVTQPDVVATIGGRQVQDAALAARGGIAWVMPGQGDLRVDATTVEVPGVRVGVSDAEVNAAPTLTGAVAVAAAKQLLGIS